jgi:phospholipid/cholesterol/gamma-HCH transport system ATP-binding protein
MNTEQEEQIGVEDAPGPIDDGQPVIRINNLSKAFGSKQVLNGLSTEIKRGENVVVLGKSGTGKSVLIKCMVGLVQPDAGEMEVLGKNVLALDEMEMNEMRKKIGFLFQSAALYDSMTVRQNLEFPLKRHLHIRKKPQMGEMVEEALENVGLLDAINKMPSELSGGMRKRIGLARTLIMKPQIILYDEPTTGLDPVTSREISHLILEVQKKYNTTSVIITHDMDCARITSNRVMVLKDGKFVAEGAYRELEKSEDKEIRAFFI